MFDLGTPANTRRVPTGYFKEPEESYLSLCFDYHFAWGSVIVESRSLYCGFCIYYAADSPFYKGTRVLTDGRQLYERLQRSPDTRV
jgi:hypothetical protein